MVEFKDFVSKLERKLSLIHSLYGADKVDLSCDSLNKKKKKVDYDMIYVSINESKQESGLFLFGSSFFISDLSEQEFKKKLTLNSLNLKIFKAYKSISEKSKKVKVSDLLNEIQNKGKDSAQLDKLLQRILSLAYYFDWDLVKDKKDLEGDRFISIPEKFLFRLRQRFNFDNLSSVYENSEVFIFLNGRGTLNLVFKDKDTFSREDIIKSVLPVLRKVFSLKSVNLLS